VREDKKDDSKKPYLKNRQARFAREKDPETTPGKYLKGAQGGQ